MDIADAVYAFSFFFRGGPAPLAPFTECGDDPTADDPLGCAEFMLCAGDEIACLDAAALDDVLLDLPELPLCLPAGLLAFEQEGLGIEVCPEEGASECSELGITGCGIEIESVGLRIDNEAPGSLSKNRSCRGSRRFRSDRTRQPEAIRENRRGLARSSWAKAAGPRRVRILGQAPIVILRIDARLDSLPVDVTESLFGTTTTCDVSLRGEEDGSPFVLEMVFPLIVEPVPDGDSEIVAVGDPTVEFADATMDVEGSIVCQLFAAGEEAFLALLISPFELAAQALVEPLGTLVSGLRLCE